MDHSPSMFFPNHCRTRRPCWLLLYSIHSRTRIDTCDSSTCVVRTKFSMFRTRALSSSSDVRIAVSSLMMSTSTDVKSISMMLFRKLSTQLRSVDSSTMSARSRCWWYCRSFEKSLRLFFVAAAAGPASPAPFCAPRRLPMRPLFGRTP